MMTRKVILKYSLLYLFILILVCGYMLNHSKQEAPAITKALQPLLVMHNEFEGNNNPLMIHSTKHTHHFLVKKDQGKYAFIHSLMELVPSDDNHNNMIDPSDPVYETLFLATLDPKTGHLKYQPLHETMISAINLIPALPTKVSNAADIIIPNNHQDSPNLHMIINAELFAEEDIKKLKKS